MLVDFETGHFGDPAFDLGFFLSHLVLKAFYHAPRHEPLLTLTTSFWRAYEGVMAPLAGRAEYGSLVRRAVEHFAGCALARLDGKSGVDYLDDASRRAAVRRLCRQLLAAPPANWDEVLTVVRQAAGGLPPDSAESASAESR
jgi:5-methylthioribose kinase